MAKTVLVVDDDPTQRRLLQAAVEKAGFACRVAPDGESGLNMARNVSDGIDVMLLDLVMPGMSGMDVLKKLREVRPELPIMVLTATGSIDTVVQAMRAGAVDFFVKPASPERVVVSIRNALQMTDLKTEVTRLKKKSSGEMSFDDMIASAPAMRQVVRLGQRAASSNIPILVLGESGVGKEVIARSIQGASDRSGRPFISVNCGAIPENLVESTLFGHEKGSFTGAIGKQLGKFVEADGGTLFLDEVGELPLDMQVKLLRVLQEGEVDAIGSRRPTKVDVRIISATNKNLSNLVESGQFREDLFYRLNVFPIEMPALRERKDDIPALTQHFIKRFNVSEGTKVSGATAETMALLDAYHWPGNVRQLENMIFRAVVLCEGNELQPIDFPQLSSLLSELPELTPIQTPAAANDANIGQESQPQAVSAMELSHPVQVTDLSGDLRTLEDVERDLIQYAIDFYAGHMSEVARKLGIGRSTLYRKVREHDLRVKPEDNEAEAG